MRVIFFIFVLLGNFVNGQAIDPSKSRINVYEHLIKEIYKINHTQTNQKIYIDPSIYQFGHVEMTSFGLYFHEPIINIDQNFCQNLSNATCVEKSAIDQFDLDKLLINHQDEKYVDFYGIYAPLDHWFAFIKHLFHVTLENEHRGNVELTFPVKHLYYKGGKKVNELILFKYKLDNDLNVLHYQKINI